MPVRGITGLAQTLVYYRRLQEIVANNIANSETQGYKADRFRLELLANAAAPVPVTALDLRQGTFRQTARQLDLAIDGPGFFVVGTESGERLTRDGAFSLDVAGRLVDGGGDPVLGVDGAIFVTGSAVEVSTDGQVTVDGQVMGTLRIETVDNPATLTKEGSSRFVASDPTKPADPTGTRVRQGMIEESNFNVTVGMTDLISLQRDFQANLSALRAMDDVLDNMVNEIGRPLR